MTVGECDCGRPLPRRTAEACGICQYLDGARGNVGQQRIISAFRQIGAPATIRNLCELTGMSYCNVQYTLLRMIKGRRVRRHGFFEYVEDCDKGWSGKKSTKAILYGLVTQ